MKTLTIITALVILCGYYAALAGDPVWLTELKAPQVELPALNNEPSHSIMMKEPDACQQFKRQEIAGWVLFGTGLAALAGGSFMIYRGVSRMVGAAPNMENPSSAGPVIRLGDIMYTSAGSALAFAGLVLTPAGLAVGITGTLRYSKYCARSTYLITPVIDGYGLGIAASF